MPSFKFKNVVISHPELNSKVATMAALLNEVIKWGEDIGLQPNQITSIVESFKRPVASTNLQEDKDDN